MNGYGKYLTPLLTLIGLAVTAYHDPIQLWIAAHPMATSVIASLSTLAATFAPQPHK